MLRNSKNLLAKLLATEDIYVRQVHGAHTASFNLKTRVLILPLWKDISEENLDMLIGHETGHALYTDRKVWENQIDWIEKNLGISRHIAHSFVNIVEDIRIDKLQQRKYPGLKRDYAKGYAEWHDKDFFGVGKRKYSDMGFMDRLNLYYKGGYDRFIPFSDVERVFVDKAADLETQDDVLEYIKSVYSLTQIPKNSANQILEDLLGSLEDNGIEIEEDDETPPQNNSERSIPNIVGESETKPGDRQIPSKQQPGHYDGVVTSLGDGATERKAKQSLEEIVDTTNFGDKDIFYRFEPKMLPGYEDYRKTLAMFQENAALNPELFEKAERTSTRFVKKEQSIVSYMWKEYEIKKQADVYSKTRRSSTGSLDMNKLHSYKTNDDIFKIGEIKPEGKNHGILMFIDFSGSMKTKKLHQAVRQAVSLALFCRQAGIAFDVYAFTSSYKQEETGSFYCIETGSRIPLRAWLVPVLSSRMTLKDFNFAKTCLFMSIYDSGSVGLHQGNTPLNDVILGCMSIIPDFRKMYQIQNMTTVFLTDGESNGIYLSRYGTKAFIEYKGITLEGGDTKTFIEFVKNFVDSRFVNFFIGSSFEASCIRRNLAKHDMTMSDPDFEIKGYVPYRDTVYDEFYFMGEGDKSSGQNKKLNKSVDEYDDEDDEDDEDESFEENETLNDISESILEENRDMIKERIILKSFINTLTENHKMG